MFRVLMTDAPVRCRFVASVLMIFMALASAGVANAAGLVVSTGVVPLSGFFQDIQIDGWVHVVVQQPPAPNIPTTVHANLPAIDVAATDSLGRSYLTHGAGATSLVCIPGDPCTPTISGFMLHRVPFINGIPTDPCIPVDPCKPVPFSLYLNLKINLDGTLNAEESNASVFE